MQCVIEKEYTRFDVCVNAAKIHSTKKKKKRETNDVWLVSHIYFEFDLKWCKN